MDDAGSALHTRMHITVAWSFAPRQTHEKKLLLPGGACVRDAIAGAGLDHTMVLGMQCAVWGKAASLSEPLKAGDRVECLRPLLVDPKVARRERFHQQGKRAAGLFARR